MPSIFYTFGTYGWRLPGDSRETTSRKDGSRIAANPGLHRTMTQLLKYPPVRLDEIERARLFDSVFAFCYDNRVIVDALNAREQHVHALFTPLIDISCEKLIARLKIFLTNALRQSPRLANAPVLWSRSYYATYIYGYRAWYNRFVYTLEKQGSAAYLRHTRFAERVRLVFTPDGEPNLRSLRNAFVSSKVHGYRKKTLNDENYPRVLARREFEDEE